MKVIKYHNFEEQTFLSGIVINCRKKNAQTKETMIDREYTSQNLNYQPPI